MPKLKINGKEIEVPQGTTVLQACEQLGIEVPRFCYHDRLSIAGNCRMCLVEMEKSPKPIASCAMPAGEGMVIHTNTPNVEKARKGVMEFLLINHPLDCPICDQGGECDLQDQAYMYGGGSNRFHENKRAVKDKYMGPLIKTHMTRCIHCTRCIRFATQIAGVPELGATGRGEHMEVGTYVEKTITSELSGNMIDLCPVGALTSKPYAFKARSWELRKTESIDIMDAVGSNIRIDYRGKEVMRILPKLNEAINEEWISDKARFAYDGLKYQRLDQPYIKSTEGKFTKTSWEDALDEIKKLISSHKPSEIGIITGNLVDVETNFLVKKLADHLKITTICGINNLKIDTSNPASYLFNTSIQQLEQADFCLLIGANPRFDASLVGARLRKRYLKGNFPVFSIGEINDQTYPVTNLGNDLSVISQIIAGNHEIVKILKEAKKPVIIIGENILARDDALAIQHELYDLCNKYNFIQENWNGYNVLHQTPGQIGAALVGLSGNLTITQILEKAKMGNIKVLLNVGADEFDLTATNTQCKTIYIGTHGDNGAHQADIILPAASYTEKNATYLNLEGRIQRTQIAISPPNMATSDWVIINNLAMLFGSAFTFNTLHDLHQEMNKNFEWFDQVGKCIQTTLTAFGIKGEIKFNANVSNVCSNYYLTNPIARASKIMAECAKLIKQHNTHEAA
ncbi:NADH-quinone oxidoreductase subunit NuoG [Rickettsiales endosymbiont of Stachyamoeba lipophora]|uniref:NADH-quinone oxidoreductase subunit NuoG n=1 Tax=Rickettsiales endosymbiont of Stachyamoeba lipophora TaxID=2486578 RepID=UPI000F648ACB|nr:NADH-quinone oxidoreductase subunit NuoG [Rickettsiales endosymbiont of Stachyamoeba lipophora]AZL16003.1 NADH-quinone oxidoreductase subunit G [Rickettsiales endosymbiont of Stachyamoeba lipophora]